jgi:hypothetical protein
MIGVMSNTKWEELRAAMYALGRARLQFRIKDLDANEPGAWDGEWFYHFRGSGYVTIEWVELRTPDPEQRNAVRDCLRDIHVPGAETAEGFRVVGWVRSSESVAYIG